MKSPFDIAWHYLKATGEVDDEQTARLLITQTLDGLRARGVSNPLMLANRAIRVFQASKQPMKMVS